MIQIELSNPSFESCIKCIHSDDSEETCILRRCIHAVAQLKECYVPKKPTIEPQQKWIPCKDRLPGQEQRVLINLSDGDTSVGWLLRGNIWFTDYSCGKPEDEVVAWMPLPEPYREGAQE